MHWMRRATAVMQKRCPTASPEEMVTHRSIPPCAQINFLSLMSCESSSLFSVPEIQESSMWLISQRVASQAETRAVEAGSKQYAMISIVR